MAIKGAILGDILGSQFEGGKTNDWKHVPLLGPDCCFTDDTVTTLAIKKAILENRDFTEVMVELCRKYINAGYGGTFIQWILSKNPRPYGSWGNGSAMRVSYIGEHFDDISERIDMAQRSAEISHSHEEGIKGAVVTAECIAMARFGRSKDDIYNYVLHEYPIGRYQYTIADSLDDLRDRYKWSVSCQETVPVAIRCFYESTDYESFMRNIFSLDCDSDTFGAVAGGVAEEFYGGFGDIPADDILKEYLTEELYNIMVA